MSWRRREDVLDMSWRRFCKTSWRRLEDILKTSWECLEDILRMFEDVLKMSWRRMTKMNILVLIKTSWKRLEYVLKTYDQDKYIGLDQDVLKTSSEDVWVRLDQDVLKRSSSRRIFAGILLLNWLYIFLFFSFCYKNFCSKNKRLFQKFPAKKSVRLYILQLQSLLFQNWE